MTRSDVNLGHQQSVYITVYSGFTIVFPGASSSKTRGGASGI